MAGNKNSGRRVVRVEIPNTVIPHLGRSINFTHDDYAQMLILLNQGKSHKEIASIMGRTVGSIDARIYRIKKKFASMRHIEAWGGNGSGLERMTTALKAKTNGCKYHGNCDTCPYPACVFDGFDPGWEIPVKKVPVSKRWTPTEVQHWNELERLPEPLDDTTLANIFRTTPELIREFRERRRTGQW